MQGPVLICWPGSLGSASTGLVVACGLAEPLCLVPVLMAELHVLLMVCPGLCWEAAACSLGSGKGSSSQVNSSGLVVPPMGLKSTRRTCSADQPHIKQDPHEMQKLLVVSAGLPSGPYCSQCWVATA